MMHYATETLKFKRLVRRLRSTLGAVPVEPETIVVGLLERLWHLAIREARDGNLAKYTREDIAELVGWTGEANTLVDALVGERWLDADSSGGLKIHDWHEHKPGWLKGVDRRAELRLSAELSSQLSSELSNLPSSQLSTELGSEPSTVLLSREPNHTIPEHTKANQTRPNKNLAAAASGEAAAIFDFGCLADTESLRSSVVIAARKLHDVAGKVIAREHIWSVAWISEAVTPGFCSELATKLRGGSVNNFKRYVDSALRGELQQRGVTFAQCAELVPACPPAREAASA